MWGTRTRCKSSHADKDHIDRRDPAARSITCDPLSSHTRVSISPSSEAARAGFVAR